MTGAPDKIIIQIASFLKLNFSIFISFFDACPP
jgi:hypothetical protein